MKYFKILKISYNDSLETTYCREIDTEEITDEDGTSKIFTKYKKIGYLYGDTVLEEENENIENYSSNHRRRLEKRNFKKNKTSRASSRESLRRNQAKRKIPSRTRRRTR